MRFVDTSFWVAYRFRRDDHHGEAVAAGRLLDVAVLDHVIIGHDAYVSLRDRGVAFADR